MSKRNRHAINHGRYAAEHIAERLQLAELQREMRGLDEQVEGEK